VTNNQYLKVSNEKINYLFKMALIEKKQDIVELFIGFDTDLQSFLSQKTLEKLYNNQNVKFYQKFKFHLK